jgi:3-hydroxyacyl-CoA dehydrogenase / 3-hydroxy-2-methylbutyryl-CoA dehydrogenase
MRRNNLNEDGERGVNTDSAAAFDGQIGQAADAASKGEIVRLSLPLVREFAAYGIRVCAVALGLVQTPTMALLPKSVDVPFRARRCRPSEFAGLAAAIVRNPMLGKPFALTAPCGLPLVDVACMCAQRGRRRVIWELQ